jgi:hypothetical protein
MDMTDLVGIKIAHGVLVDGSCVGRPIGVGGHGVLRWSFLSGPRWTGSGKRSALHLAPHQSHRDGHICIMLPPAA